MKRTIIPVLFLFTMAGFIACQKEGSESPLKLDVAKTSAIKKGEPVLFTVNNAPAAVTWSVNPSANVQVNNNGNKASILFGAKGTYEVRATSGNLIASRTVNVNDTIYTGGGGTSGGGTGGGGITYTTVPLTGDNIALTVTKIDSGSTSGLIIRALTGNSYNCLNNFLESNVAVSGADYTLNFIGVKVPDAANCTSGQAKASSFSYLYPVAAGSHVFKVTLNGTTYTGSLTKTGNSFTFTWPYSSGVTISPLTL